MIPKYTGDWTGMETEDALYCGRAARNFMRAVALVIGLLLGTLTWLFVSG